MQCTDDLISQIRALVAGGRCDEPLSSVWAQAEALSGPASARKMRSVWRWQVAPILGVPHSLRHSAATMELGGGLDVRNVAAKLGHASIATTEAYLHASRVPAASAIARLEGWSW